jgi:hypothetical protein
MSDNGAVEPAVEPVLPDGLKVVIETGVAITEIRKRATAGGDDVVPCATLDPLPVLRLMRREIDAAEKKLVRAKSRRRKFADVLASVRIAEPPHVISTGVSSLDQRLGEGGRLSGAGWVLGRLFVIAAYVGSYKTRGLLTYALAALEAGVRVLFVSAEMIAEELALIVWDNYPDGADMEVLDQTYDLSEVAAEIHSFMTEGDGRPSIVFLDYAQVLSNQAEARTREREVASITRALSQLARREKVAIVATAQLNRASQSDDSPKLSHLRESGAIEADADVVLLTAYDRPRLSIICKKHRFGLINWELDVKVDAETCTFQAYTETEVADDRLLRIQEAVEKRVLASGPTPPRDLYQSIRIRGVKARAYEVSSVVARSLLVNLDADGNIAKKPTMGVQS